MNKIYVYDIETYKSVFCAVFKCINTKKIYTFEISSRKNECIEMLEFIKGSNLIGYNNLNFDYPVIHWIILNYKNYSNGSKFAEDIHFKANDIINQEYSAIRPKEVLISQLDLFKIHHFDNKARSTSLKALEIAMRLDNVKDLPLDPNLDIEDKYFNDIIEYCINDVNATFEFYIKSLNEIQLRVDLSREYKLNLYNANDPKIGEEIFLDALSKEMNISKYDLKKMRSPIKMLEFNQYILDYISFKTDNFNKLLSFLKRFRTCDTKGSFKYSAKLGDFTIDYGQGGLHGCIKPGIYESTNELLIVDIDVASYYPNLAINNKFRPKHLGEAFSKVYKRIYDLRKTFLKSDPKNYGCKIALNGSFGKMNDENSFLYDPESLLKITLNGQLLLSMLMEDIHLEIPVRFLQGNTDGFTFMCHKNDLEIVKRLVKNWEYLTGLEMEYAYYSKMIIRDVNNYTAIYKDGTIKYKGCFEINRAWHKNHSMLIVPKALSNYFIDNIPIRKTIESCDNILDFCKRARAPKNSKLILRDIKDNIELQKNNRYYIAKYGKDLYKLMPPLINEEGFDKRDKLNKFRKENPLQTDLFQMWDDVLVDKSRETNLEVGYKCEILNKLEEVDSHMQNINIDYYIRECYKIINAIEGK